MSEAINDKDAIILAASERFVVLGTIGGQRMMEGRESTEQDAEAQRIMFLLRVMENEAELSDDDIESVLYCLRQLSGETEFPTVSPFIGKKITNIIQVTQVVSAMRIQNNGVDLPQREKLNFTLELEADDDGTVNRAFLRDEASSATVDEDAETVTLDFEGRRRMMFLANQTISEETTLVIINDSRANVLDAFVFTVDAGVGITIVGRMSDGRRVAGVWTSLDAGTFIMTGLKIGGNWYLTISPDKYSA